MNNQIDYKQIYEYEHRNSSGYNLNNWGLISIKFWISYFDFGFSPIIEVGCSNGKLLDALVAMGKTCTGVDVIKNIYERQNYKYLQLDISKNKLPYSDKSFDLGISFDVFEHLSEPDFAIKELIRVSKSQLIAVPHGSSKASSGNVTKHLHLSIHLHQWWLDKLCDLSEDGEWQAIHLIRQNGKWVETFNSHCNRTLYLRRAKE